MDMIIKTRRRFMTLMMHVAAVIIVAALVSIYWLTYSSQETSNRQRLSSFEEISITGEGSVLFGVAVNSSPEIGTYFSMLVDNQGQILSAYYTEEEQSQEFLQEAADIAWSGENYGKVELEGRLWQYSISSAGSQIIIANGFQLNTSEISWQICFVDITQSRQTLQLLAFTLCAIGILLLVFFFFFSLFFSKRAIRPLIEVMEKQQQFVADASHELKTPVSIIKANCGVLYANEEDTIENQVEWLDNIMTGADRMTSLIHGLIALAKIEETDNEIIKSEILLEDEINKALSMMDFMIKEKSLTVETGHCAYTIWSDVERFRQVINIVLENAIKYSNNGGMIQISITQEKKHLCMSVLNTGDGIAEKDITKIFDRFYRAEGARTQDGNYGLGLSIAQAVMRQLGGSITAESVVGKNAVFSLRFPIA